ncbi:hypothetical protein ACN28I_27720 [Archangium gephyra]|uniref:hypothetical protein n=1 Tax=Archangium gephyra TaxID=48 RepID=UPI003B8214E3
MSSEVQALRSFIGYHSVHPRNPSRAQVILQMELTVSDSGELQQVTGVSLEANRQNVHLQVRQAHASVGGGLRLLVEGSLDLHRLQTVPHDLYLKGRGGGSVRTAILANIMLR